MKVSLKSITPTPEKTIIEIARVSSSRVDKTENPAPLVNHLIKNNHWSPFEHAMMTIEIVTSKAIGIQLLRHRSFTFQEFSQRYARVTEVEPIEIRRQAIKNRQSSEEVFNPKLPRKPYTHNSLSANDSILQYIEQGQQLYNDLLNADVAKECARMILPMSTQTTIYMSGTIRSWIHLLDIRDDLHAQLEIQLIAKEIKKIFIEQCPMIAEARGW
jgi:thymidylate synthase (FAD)